MNPDVVEMIMQDHREQERLARDLLYHPRKARCLVPLLMTLLASHCRAEEAVVYPASLGAGYEGLTEHCQAEHLAIDGLLDTLVSTDSGEVAFGEHLRALIDLMAVHHEREELQLLPHLRDRLDAERLAELTDLFAERRAELLIGEVAYAGRRVLQQQAVNAGISRPERLTQHRLEEALTRARAGLDGMSNGRLHGLHRDVTEVPTQR